jgi:hypothetical protein
LRNETFTNIDKKQMTIFRYKKDGCLYTLYKVSPRHYTGSWTSAEPYFPNQGKYIKEVKKLDDFEVVAER